MECYFVCCKEGTRSQFRYCWWHRGSCGTEFDISELASPVPSIRAVGGPYLGWTQDFCMGIPSILEATNALTHDPFPLSYGCPRRSLGRYLEVQGNYSQATSVTVINHLQAASVALARLYLGCKYSYGMAMATLDLQAPYVTPLKGPLIQVYVSILCNYPGIPSRVPEALLSRVPVPCHDQQGARQRNFLQRARLQENPEEVLLALINL